MALMWAALAASVVGPMIAGNSQKGQATSAAVQAAHQRQGQSSSYTPTTQNPNLAPPEAMEMASGGTPGAPPPGQQGNNTLGNVNNAVQLGATLQQIMRAGPESRRNANAAALGSAPRGQAMPFQPSAGQFADPRLQQLMRR